MSRPATWRDNHANHKREDRFPTRGTPGGHRDWWDGPSEAEQARIWLGRQDAARAPRIAAVRAELAAEDAARRPQYRRRRSQSSSVAD